MVPAQLRGATQARMAIAVKVYRRRLRGSNFWASLFVGLVLVFLLAPLIVVIIFSFHNIPRMSLPLNGLSLRWYRQLFSDAEVHQSMKRSLAAAMATAVIATPLGISAALGLRLLSARLHNFILTVILLPSAVPGLLLAVALAIYWKGTLGLGFSLTVAVAGHVLLALPFVVLTMNASVSNFRYSLLEAARDLGASQSQTFRDVLFPLIRPAIEGSALLAMATSIDEFIVTLFVGGRDTTLPLLIWGRIQRSVDPSLNALATCLLLATTLLAFIAVRRTSVKL